MAQTANSHAMGSQTRIASSNKNCDIKHAVQWLLLLFIQLWYAYSTRHNPMIASMDLQILLRLKPHPMRGHRLVNAVH